MPALEPLIMANIARGVPGKDTIATLSLVYKLDIVCCLALATATSVAPNAIAPAVVVTAVIAPAHIRSMA